MIEILGWVSTLLVLAGYILNAQKLTKYAMITWIVGDIGWVTYDFFIYNISHMMLSFIIITINIYGIWNVCKTQEK
jgi:hypothetical protein